MGNIVDTYNELAELVALARRGAVRLETTTCPLEGINDALQRPRRGPPRRRGVLVPGGS